MNTNNNSESEFNPNNKSDLKCAPGVSFKHGSCISLQLLLEMVNAYNKYNDADKIIVNTNLETLNPKKLKKYILTEFTKRMSDKYKCQTQKCWSEQEFIDLMKSTALEELQKHTFRPNGPEGKFEWLNTININEIMIQNENTHPGFNFLGTVPIDFDKFERYGFINLNFEELLQNNKTKIGAVFNLDKHNEPGSHWVALYADLIKREVYFFDSYGILPDKRIRAFMRRIVKFFLSKSIDADYKADYNKIRHQYKNSECGVYSINFIKRMLRGDEFQDICNSKTNDDTVNKCRRIYFNNVNK
jgi:hypothetical protein